MKRMAFIVLIFSSVLFFTNGVVHAQLANSPWPMFRHDAQHTGRSPYAGPQTGALSWSYVTGDWVNSSPSIGSDGSVYVGSDDNRLYSFTSAGALSWTYVTGNIVSSSPAIGSDGALYVGSGDNRLYSLTSTGALLWSYVMGSGVSSSPAIGSDGALYVGSYDHRLYSLTPTGALSWSYKMRWYVSSSPAIGSDGTLYVGSYDNRLYSLTSTGALSWSYVMGYWVTSSPAIGSDGTLYVGAYDYRLYSLTSTGALSWSYRTGEALFFSSPAIGSDGTLYAASGDHKLYSFTPTGALSWSYRTGYIVSSLPAIGSDGALYVGSSDDRLYSLTSTGALSWSYVAGCDVDSSPAIGSDGALYVGSEDNRLYCLQDPTPPGPTPTPGPEKLALLVRQASNDLNIYFWNSPDAGDWTRWDALARNPSPLARDFWQIPVGNDGIGLTSIDFAGLSRDEITLLVRQGANDLNLYFWNSPFPGDYTHWDAMARNPSPLARDFWQIPVGNDGIGLTKIDISEPPDGSDDIALLVRQASNDLNIYFWNSPVAGDWTRWDALARNPSPLARDFWQIPIGNDGIGLTSIDISEPPDGSDEIALLVRQGVNDLNVYFWNSPVDGDWTRWDALARNPSPLARDFWQIPIGNDGIGLTSIDIDGNGKDEIGLLVRQGANDLNIYFWNAPVPGDWTQWDALSRNPSPLARDFWQIPIGNDGIGLTGLAME